jgi:hypothetical protein
VDRQSGWADKADELKRLVGRQGRQAEKAGGLTKKVSLLIDMLPLSANIFAAAITKQGRLSRLLSRLPA